MATVQLKLAIRHLARFDLSCHIIEFSLAPMSLNCSIIVGLSELKIDSTINLRWQWPVFINIPTLPNADNCNSDFKFSWPLNRGWFPVCQSISKDTVHYFGGVGMSCRLYQVSEKWPVFLSNKHAIVRKAIHILIMRIVILNSQRKRSPWALVSASSLLFIH